MPSGRPGGPQEALALHLVCPRAALRALLDADAGARELGRDVWDFAVEIRCLRAAGLTHTHLRWLVCKGYAEHRLEYTQRGDPSRLFHTTANLSLSERSCFVLTQAGMDLARQEVCPPTSGNSTEQEGTPPGRTSATPKELPYWDAGEHTLYWRGRAVKHFKREAPYQEAILAAFQA
jgi:hypothetical protein